MYNASNVLVLQKGSVLFVVQVKQSIAALTVILWCFVQDVMNFGIRRTLYVLNPQCDGVFG